MATSIELSNSIGVKVRILTYGAIIQSWEYKGQDIVLGYDTVAGYEADEFYLGAVVGRVANRISLGCFTIADESSRIIDASNDSQGKLQYQLHHCNNGPNHLHGGQKGFNSQIWTVVDCTALSVTLQYTSPHDEEGYPGTLQVNVTYALHQDKNELSVSYTGRLLDDHPTHVNLSQHSYFNLEQACPSSSENVDEPLRTVEDYVLQIHADFMTPTDETSIPTGEIRPVADTVFDFRQPRALSSVLDPIADDEVDKGNTPDPNQQQLQWAKGLDHNFCLRKDFPDQLSLAATVICPRNQNQLQVWTTEPGMQVYTSNYLLAVHDDTNDSSFKGKRALRPRTGLCLETQHFPDSPNRSQFPSTLLRPGKKYQSRTIYKWSKAS